ncbi:unnamed protein product [Cunninghamella blakesleeana]
MKLIIDKPKRRDAPYQREIVWSKNKMTMLIDSAINNYYIPPLIFSVRPTAQGNIRYCIDGKQRLSSIWKFMRNEIPYVEESDEKAEDLYFDPAGTQDVLEGVADRKYLTREERDRFTSLEFTMIEYNNLTEDEELEIFSRVQLGVSLTTGEKLYAFNSSQAVFCKDLADRFDLKNIILRNNRGEALKAITHLIYLLYENQENNNTVVKTFMGHISNLEKFLKNHNVELSDAFKEKATAILIVYEKIAADSQGLQTLSFGKENKRQRLPVILFIIFGIYIHTNRRTLKQYINDLQSLRHYFDTNHTGPIILGNPTYNEGLRWLKSIEEKNRSEQNESNDNIQKSEFISFSTLPTTTTTSTSASALSSYITHSISENQTNHRRDDNIINNDSNNKNKSKSKNKPNSASNINKNSNTKAKTNNKDRTSAYNKNIFGSSEEEEEEELDSEDDEIDESDDESDDDDNIDNADISGLKSSSSNKKSLAIDSTTPTTPSKRLKLAHNNKSALNQQLKIDENKSVNRPYMGQTNRSGQPMARRGGHRK